MKITQHGKGYMIEHGGQKLFLENRNELDKLEMNIEEAKNHES